MVCALVAGAALAPPVALAQDPPRPPTEELEAARHHYDEAIAEEAALVAAYEQATRKVAELRTRARELDAALAAADAAVADAEAELARIAGELRRAQARQRRVEAALDAARDRLQDRAVDAYVHGNLDVTLMAAVLDAGTFDEVSFSTTYARAVLDDNQSAVDEYRLRRADADAAAVAVEEAQVAQQGARDTLAARSAELAAARADLAVAEHAAEDEAAHQQALAAEAEARKEAYRQRVADLEAESARIEAELRRRAEAERAAAARRSSGGGTAITPSGSARLGPPLDGVVITSSFGWRTHPIYGEPRFHAGVDLEADLGEPVYAAESGTVVRAEWCGGYGNCVVVDHGDLAGDGHRIATLYAHLSSSSVGAGARVSKGQQIGRAGTTGSSTGVHLHFEVRVDGVPVNPVPYLR